MRLALAPQGPRGAGTSFATAVTAADPPPPGVAEIRRVTAEEFAARTRKALTPTRAWRERSEGRESIRHTRRNNAGLFELLELKSV